MEVVRENAKFVTAEASIRVSHGSIDFTIIPHTESNITLHIYDRVTHERYEANEIPLKNINVKTLLTALEGKNKDVKFDISNTTCEHLELLVLKIKVSNFLLAAIEEQIACKLTKKLEETEILMESLKNIKNKINQLYSIDIGFSKAKTRWVVEQENEKYCNSGMDCCDVAELVLPQGKYLLTITFFVYLENQWLYAGLKAGQNGSDNLNTRTIPFDQNQGFYGNPSTWIPITARQTYKANQDKTRVVFELFSGSSYPSRVRNFVMTAERMD